MDSGIYRKAALGRLSSPEQLDLILRVTRPRAWMALIALFLVLSVVVVWGYTGEVPTKVSGQGVIVRTGAVLNVVTQGSGMVTEIDAKLGDSIRANQVVAKVSQPEVMEKIQLTEQELTQAQAALAAELHVDQQEAQLTTAAIERQKANDRNEVAVMDQRIKIAAQQIAVDRQLLAKGLITRLQSLADQQKQVSLEGRKAALAASLRQLDAQEYAAKAAPSETERVKEQSIQALQRELAQLHEQLNLSARVVSPYAGQVIELRTAPGALVTAGSPILTLQPESAPLEVLVYVSAEKAKAIQPGMTVEVSPSMVKREEYGFVLGKVEYVGAFPASTDALMRNFENRTLVDSITASGPVTEVRVKMNKNPKTYSGYDWSSSKGPALRLTSGTLCTVEIVTQEQRPVTLLFPLLKKKLGLS